MTAYSCQRVGGSERSYLLLVEGDPTFLYVVRRRGMYLSLSLVPVSRDTEDEMEDTRWRTTNTHTHTQIHTPHNNMAPHANVHTTPLFYCSSPLSRDHSSVYINEHNKYLRLKSTVQT